MQKVVRVGSYDVVLTQDEGSHVVHWQVVLRLDGHVERVAPCHGTSETEAEALRHAEHCLRHHLETMGES